jgi:hypothetical protein
MASPVRRASPRELREGLPQVDGEQVYLPCLPFPVDPVTAHRILRRARRLRPLLRAFCAEVSTQLTYRRDAFA